MFGLTHMIPHRACTFEYIDETSSVFFAEDSEFDSILKASSRSLQIVYIVGLFMPSNWTHAMAISTTFHTDDTLYSF